MAKRRTTAERIIDKVSADHGLTTAGMLAADLRVEPEKVSRIVRALIRDGRLIHGWDGQSIELTDRERADRAAEAEFLRSVKKMRD